MSTLTDFYRGAGTDAEGRTLARIWAFSDRELEGIHDFIQWLFSLRERSQFNPDAPILTEADVAEFRADPMLQANLLRSFGIFLAFLGLRYEDGRVAEGADFDEKRGVWEVPNHNWLRITRVLSNTRRLGQEAASRAFFDFLKAHRDAGRSCITEDSFRDWDEAANGDLR